MFIKSKLFLNSFSLRIYEFINYLKENETDNLMALRFLKQLPGSIMSIYQSELKSLEKKQSSVETLLL
jgi:hypothetical protein